MATRHGRLSRTPLTPRDPACLTGPAPVSTLAVVAGGRGPATPPPPCRPMQRHATARGTPENVRDVTFSEDTATSRTGSGPANLATIRAAIIAAIKDVGYLHAPEGRSDHTTPADALRLHGFD